MRIIKLTYGREELMKMKTSDTKQLPEIEENKRRELEGNLMKIIYKNTSQQTKI